MKYEYKKNRHSSPVFHIVNHVQYFGICRAVGLYGFSSPFPGSYSDHFLQRLDKNLTPPDHSVLI